MLQLDGEGGYVDASAYMSKSFHLLIPLERGNPHPFQVNVVSVAWFVDISLSREGRKGGGTQYFEGGWWRRVCGCNDKEITFNLIARKASSDGITNLCWTTIPYVELVYTWQCITNVIRTFSFSSSAVRGFLWIQHSVVQTFLTLPFPSQINKVTVNN